MLNAHWCTDAYTYNLSHSLWIPCFHLKKNPRGVLSSSPKRVYCSYSRTIYFLKIKYQQSMQYMKPFLWICTFNERLNNLFSRVLLCSGYVSCVCALIASVVKRCRIFMSVAFIAMVFAYVTKFSLEQYRWIAKEPLKVMMENVQKREFKIMLWCSHDGFCLKEVETDL